jgi:YD repeat-containing protein
MNSNEGRRTIALLLLGLIGAVQPVHAVEIERPKVSMVDALGVDMMTAQVTFSLTPVSIGGPMGLSYSISVYANEARWGAEGFHFSYDGKVERVVLTNEIGYPAPGSVMRASDDTGAADFVVYVNGVLQSNFDGLQPPYTYVAYGDQRQILEVNGQWLEWTKPDGTIVRYFRGTQTRADAGGALRQIVRPNGLTIDVTGVNDTVGDVRSNTGFQLRAIMVPDTRPFDKVDNPNLIGVPAASTSAASGWSANNPKFVKALNAAIEYCAPAPAACTPALTWPTATIEYPAGMPRTLFIGDSVVRVLDATQAATELRYHAYDLAYDQYNQVVQGYTPNTEFSPRLVGIKPPGATQETFAYDYINSFVDVTSAGPWGNYMLRVRRSGLVKSADHIAKHSGYTMGMPTQGGRDYRNNAAGQGGISVVFIQTRLVAGNTDLLSYADTEEGTLRFEATARNFPSKFEKISGPEERYQYDTRGNLTKIEHLVDQVYVTHMQAQYPASCTAATRKTCNQADWIADANGNTTQYTYHAASGYVATVTAPPDQNGKRAQTRYEYTQKSARYFNNAGTRITGTPIWMKTAERSCINSSYSQGACAGADEVVTRFEYDNDNLLMTGMTVTGPQGVTLRTCYQYDRFGNQIGKTTPNANRTSCT